VQKHIWVESAGTGNLYLFSYANGLLKKQKSWLKKLEPVEKTAEEQLSNFYREAPPPEAIFLNFLANTENLENFLVAWHELEQKSIVSQVSATAPDFVELALATAKQEEAKQKNLSGSLKRLLLLKNPAMTIDCFDISHHQGQNTVGACVRFVDGQPAKNDFRRFHIRSVAGIDDYQSLREVVYRRYSGTKEFPDLILIDGGKGQLNAVKDLFPEAEFASLAKREERVFRPQNDFETMPAELVSRGKKLNPQTPEGLLLISLRDYTHHFAVTFQRRLQQNFIKN
jgi:excinuclease UvrABC nuclease subunit